MRLSSRNTSRNVTSGRRKDHSATAGSNKRKATKSQTRVPSAHGARSDFQSPPTKQPKHAVANTRSVKFPDGVEAVEGCPIQVNQIHFGKPLATQVVPPSILDYLDDDPSLPTYQGPDWPMKSTTWHGQPQDRP